MSSFFTGVFAAETENPAELNKRSFARRMITLFPNGSFPLYGLLAGQPKARALSSTHGYFSKTFQFASITINGALNSGDTAFVADAFTGIIAGMVLYNPATRENIRISAVNANGTQLTATRGYGRVAAAAIDDNQVLIVIGTSFMQGSSRPTSRGITTVYVPNYTQIFRNAWALTDTARASAVEMGASNISTNKTDCALMHCIDQEMAIIFGQAKMDTTGSEPLSATQGIYDAIDQYAAINTNTAGNTTTYDQFVTMVEGAWKYSSNLGNPGERIGLCGQTALKVMNQLGRQFGVVHIERKETKIGMKFTSFEFYKGTIQLVEHPLFNAYDDLSKLMVGVELSAIQLAYMEGRDTVPEDFGGPGRNNANGVDSQGGSLTSEFAVELINPASCFVVENLTQAIA